MENISQPQPKQGGNAVVIVISVLLLGVAGFFIFKSLKKPKPRNQEGDKAKKPETASGGILGGIFGGGDTEGSTDVGASDGTQSEGATSDVGAKSPRGGGGFFGRIRDKIKKGGVGSGSSASADIPIANGQLEDSLGTTVGGSSSTISVGSDAPPKQPKISSYKSNSGKLSYKYGQKGDKIKEIQKKLGITPQTGNFGQMTFDAVWTFQKNNPPLGVDGVVGKSTWKALFGVEHPKIS